MSADPAAARLEVLLDDALSRPPEDRDAYLVNACGDDDALLARLRHLVTLASCETGFLDRSPLAWSRAENADTCHPALAPGQRLGAFQLVRLLGSGGMGEVWLGERVEGGFEQQVAIKCLRVESPSLQARFAAERAILAGLEHPGIARLYDGGATPDGRPYMVMEYVEGRDLLSWCELSRAGLDERLRLFLDVCDAVAYAHTHLVIHRDLKPANILVTPEGEIKLLDFGIARLLQGQELSDPSLTLHLSPAYAAPEQLTGGAIGTATDVHALGVTLYQLLTGTLPWPITDAPLGLAVQRLLTTRPPAVSRAATNGDPPVPPRLLRGDLDAIVEKALRAEPGSRYPDARSLADDIRRYLRHQPVQARSGARAYVAGRFVRRHWAPLAAAALVFAALAAGLLGIAWQARRASEQAARATAIKNYLLSVFRASDPRIASDQPGGQVTARELLDAGVARIEHQFADAPDLQIELLGLTAGIYRELGERERYAALHSRHMELARQHHGDLHPVVLHGLLREVDDAMADNDYAEALRKVEAIDPLIRQARLDDSPVRGKWWLRKGRALENDANRWEERAQAFDEAARLLERTDPGDRDYAAALGGLAAVYWERDTRGSAALADEYLMRAVEAERGARDRDDGELQVLYASLGLVRSWLNDGPGADAAFSQAMELARRTYGEDNWRYWYATSQRARSLHSRGEREEALRLFDALRARLPAEPAIHEQDTVALALTSYGAALVRDGRPAEALPILEEAERGYLRANRGYRMAFLQRMLGEALEGVGRADDARRYFKASLESLLEENPADSATVLAGRERWARFLLGLGEFSAAKDEFLAVLDVAGDRRPLSAVLAHAGLARIALAACDAAVAQTAIAHALAQLNDVEGELDVRVAPYLAIVHARALLLAGDTAGAEAWGKRALDGYVRYTHPDSAEIRDARQFLGELTIAPAGGRPGCSPVAAR